MSDFKNSSMAHGEGSSVLTVFIIDEALGLLVDLTSGVNSESDNNDDDDSIIVKKKRSVLRNNGIGELIKIQAGFNIDLFQDNSLLNAQVNTHFAPNNHEENYHNKFKQDELFVTQSSGISPPYMSA
ncbi:MAG: hypothetical protein EPN22_09575 [Nitrospirae bacterium]|nr:MAG: hypothetical protein EPN22_09575 [Nitrospirota bacterium]